jgi:hypothetical protein
VGSNHVLAPAFQGFGDAIPPFLRFDGPVKNKKPSKKEVVNLLKDAWKERIAEEQVSSHGLANAASAKPQIQFKGVPSRW